MQLDWVAGLSGSVSDNTVRLWVGDNTTRLIMCVCIGFVTEWYNHVWVDPVILRIRLDTLLFSPTVSWRAVQLQRTRQTVTYTEVAEVSNKGSGKIVGESDTRGSATRESKLNAKMG